MTKEHPILQHVRSAIAANRRPGLHFPGFFLEMETIRLDEQGAQFAVAHGPHCVNANGDMNIGAIALLADMGLGMAMRAHVSTVSRMATATLQLYFTGARATSSIECRGQFDGIFQGAQYKQGRVSGELTSAGQIICHGSGTFATPPAPPGVTMHALPLEHMGPRHRPQPMPVSEMSDDERLIMKAARSALRKASPERSFVEHFWEQIATPSGKEGGGAANTVKFGPHIGNRVGHMQGGVIFAVAVATAVAAVPGNSLLTSASAWYISPGTGDRLKVRSTVLQLGKTIAVVRTEVLSGKRLVLAMMTSHTY